MTITAELLAQRIYEAAHRRHNKKSTHHQPVPWSQLHAAGRHQDIAFARVVMAENPDETDMSKLVDLALPRDDYG